MGRSSIPLRALLLLLTGCGGSFPSGPGENGAGADDRLGSAGAATLMGTVRIGPLCPVESEPPDPGCLPTPELFAGVELFVHTREGAWVKTVDLDAAGGFAVELEAGSYVLDSSFSAGGGGAWPPDTAASSGGSGSVEPGDPGEGGCCDPAPGDPPATVPGVDPPTPVDTLYPPIPIPLPSDSSVVWPDSGWVIPEPPGWPALPDTTWPTEPAPGPDGAPGSPPVDTLPPPPRAGSGEERVTLPVALDLVPGEVRRLDIDIDTGIR